MFNSYPMETLDQRSPPLQIQVQCVPTRTYDESYFISSLQFSHGNPLTQVKSIFNLYPMESFGQRSSTWNQCSTCSSIPSVICFREFREKVKYIFNSLPGQTTNLLETLECTFELLQRESSDCWERLWKFIFDSLPRQLQAISRLSSPCSLY